MPSETVGASPLDIVRQKLSEYKGNWERVKFDILHDPSYSPFSIREIFVGRNRSLVHRKASECILTPPIIESSSRMN